MNEQEQEHANNEDRFERIRQYRQEQRLRVTRGLLEGLRTNSIKGLFHHQHDGEDQQQQSCIFKFLSSESSGLDMDDFLQAAQENTSVTSIRLKVPFRIDPMEYENPDQWRHRWAEFTRGIGSLKGLKELTLVDQGQVGIIGDNSDNNIVSAANIDMELTALAIKRCYKIETLKIGFSISMDDNCEPLALALQAHPSLKCIEFLCRTDQTPIDVISPQLGTMPKLSSIKFTSLASRGVQFRTLPDSFFKHLASVTNLKELSLRQCVLTQRQCELLSGPLMKAGIQRLDLCDSMFLGSGGIVLAKALRMTTTLKGFSISLLGLDSLALCEELSLAFLNNSKELKFVSIQSVSNGLSDANIFSRFEPAWFIPFFHAMRKIPALEEVHVCDLDRWTNSVADEFRELMELPTSSIRILEVLSYGLAPAWSRIEPFLQFNTTLRSLTLSNCINCVEANKLASLLDSNKYLERLEIHATDGKCSFDYLSDYARWLRDQGFTRMPTLFDKDKFIQWCNVHTPEGNYRSKGEMVCNLNRAGRRYIARDHADKARGVKVLSLVANNLDYIFYHLRENPSLCELRDPATRRGSSSTRSSTARKRKLSDASLSD